jgi:DNA-binding NarL/FixJ family response regulator
MTKPPSRTSSASKKIRVFRVDDHPIVRRGFQLLLSMEQDMMVCGEADNASAALEKICSLMPDVAIVDLFLKSSSGLDLIHQLHAQCPKLKILVFSMRNETIFAERALHAGAHGYIIKEDGPDKAIEAIRLLMQGKTCLSQPLAEAMMARLPGTGSLNTPSFESLSDREIEVLTMIGKGLSSREIAEKLHLSIKTVESHREHIKEKLGLQKAAQLVSYAFNWLHGE